MCLAMGEVWLIQNNVNHAQLRYLNMCGRLDCGVLAAGEED